MLLIGYEMRFWCCFTALVPFTIIACGGETILAGVGSSSCRSDEQCDDSDPCTVDTCDVAEGTCSSAPIDGDGDGFAAERVGTAICTGDDCDDGDAGIHPGADIGCTDSDLDCNGFADVDNDGDGHDRQACEGDDCDDTNRHAYPGAIEICNDGIDEDCDLMVDGPLRMGLPVLVSGEEHIQFGPSIAWTGSEYGLVWSDRRHGNFELYFAIAAADGGPVATETRITAAGQESIFPSMTWTGSEFGFAWYDERDGQPEIYFTRVDASGSEIGGNIRLTTSGTASNPPSYPSYVMPSIDWTGSEYGVLWPDARDGARAQAYMMLLDPSGDPAGPEIRLTEGRSVSSMLDVVWTGSEHALTWADTSSLEVLVARISVSGAVVDLLSSRSEMDPGDSRIVWTGSSFSLAWYGVGMEEMMMFHDVISPPGYVFSPAMLESPRNGSSHPEIAWTGSMLGVVWKEQVGEVGEEDYELWFGMLPADSDEWIAPPIPIAMTDRYSCCYGSMDMVWSGSELAIVYAGDEAGIHDVYLQRIGLCD